MDQEQALHLHHPWLVAVWPGMGGVAVNAGYYMLAKLGMHVMAEYEASGMSRREFCSACGLAVATLDLYRKRARQLAERSVSAGSRRLVSVEIDGDSGAVREASAGSAVRSIHTVFKR